MLYDNTLHCISFFTMFHAFRCVLDCWKLCAIRFGLGFNPWCNYFYHVTCSCIFHAFVPFLFFFFALFLLCSLSLSHRLRMAPKCKSNPTQNPFRSRFSSSSDLLIPSLHIRFRGEKAHQDFSENFSKRGVHPERHVILSDFAGTPLPDVIHTRGWESLCEIPLRCPIVFIQNFYFNMHGIDTSVPQFAIGLQGTRIVVTLNLVSKILHVPWVA